MDASDTTKKRKTAAIYIDKINTFIAKNPGGDCAVTSNTCCASISSCVKTFESFELKYNYYAGLNNCVQCPNPVPENGGSR